MMKYKNSLMLKIFNIYRKNNIKNMAKIYNPLDLTKIIPVDDLPDKVYFPEETTKKQIVLHHTVSNPISVEGDVKTWTQSNNGVSTCVIIQGDGVPYQLYSSKYWSHHLGISSKFLKEKGFTDFMSRNTILNKASLGIEIDNWGGLVLGDGATKKDFGKGPVVLQKDKFYTAYGNIINVNSNDIIEFKDGFRGYKHFQKYTQAQIDTTAELLLLWKNKWNIPLTYNEDMWDVNVGALSGKPGVWTHTSFRSDKSDCFPQPELIEMLKSIS